MDRLPSAQVDEWMSFMWNELLDAPFITSAEKQGLAPYYAQACANKWPVDDQDDAATAAPAPAATSVRARGANHDLRATCCSDTVVVSCAA